MGIVSYHAHLASLDAHSRAPPGSPERGFCCLPAVLRYCPLYQCCCAAFAPMARAGPSSSRCSTARRVKRCNDGSESWQGLARCPLSSLSLKRALNRSREDLERAIVLGAVDMAAGEERWKSRKKK